MAWTSCRVKGGCSSFFMSPFIRSMGGSPELRWQSDAACCTLNVKSCVIFMVFLKGSGPCSDAAKRQKAYGKYNEQLSSVYEFCGLYEAQLASRGPKSGQGDIELIARVLRCDGRTDATTVAGDSRRANRRRVDAPLQQTVGHENRCFGVSDQDGNDRGGGVGESES